jgi:transposase
VLGTTRNVRVYAAPTATDMRKGFDGLLALARDVICQEPLSGHLFLFVAKNRKRAKVLFWDGTGLCIFHKRLEQGRFVAPWQRAELTMTGSELALLLEGSTHVRAALSPSSFLRSSGARAV